MLINKDVIALCDISLTCFIYIYLFTKICTHRKKKKVQKTMTVVIWIFSFILSVATGCCHVR